MKKKNLSNERYNLEEMIEKCSKLLSEGKYDQVIHILENVSKYLVVDEENNDGEEFLVFLLCLAYHGIAASQRNLVYYEKMIVLLNRFKHLLEKNASWNGYMGKAYLGLKNYKKAVFYLEEARDIGGGEPDIEIYLATAYCFINREDQALDYFKKFTKYAPNNPYFKERVTYCYDALYFPYFKENFNQRVKLTWEEFSKQEETLRELANQYFEQAKDPEYLIAPPAKIFHMIYDILELTVDELIIFWRKRNGKIQIILSTNYTRYKVFTMEKLVSKMPEHLKEHWEFLVGIPPEGNRNIVLGDIVTADILIDTDKVFLWIDQNEDELVFSFYCERLKQFNHTSMIVLMMCDLVANQIGEFALMNFILKKNLKLDILDIPKEEEPILLTNFCDEVKKRGLEVSNNFEEYMEYQASYQDMQEFDCDKDYTIHNDVFYGKTKIPMVVQLYREGYSPNLPKIFEYFYSCGAVIGFFSCSLNSFRIDHEAKVEEYHMENLAKEWVSYVKETAGEDSVTLLGAATGILGYIDFIAWDFDAVVEATRRFFDKMPMNWVNFNSFCPESKSVRIFTKNKE